MNRLENDLGRKKTEYFSLEEDVSVLQGEQKVDKWKKCCKSGMAHAECVNFMCAQDD